MDIHVLISWKTRLHHRGWSAGQCPHCQGLEAWRIEQKVWTFAIYLLPLIQTPTGWVARCDFCRRLVADDTNPPEVKLDEWTPRDGFAPLLKRLGYTGKIKLRNAPVEIRFRSLLAMMRDASGINEMHLVWGMILGGALGVFIGMGLGLLIFHARLFNSRTDAVGFSLMGAAGGLLAGAALGAVAHWLLRRGAVAKRILQETIADYTIDLERLDTLAQSYPAHIQRAVHEVRQEQHYQIE